jgi:hypothetical protein
MVSVGSQSIEDKFIIEGSQRIYDELDLPKFADEIIKTEAKMNSPGTKTQFCLI